MIRGNFMVKKGCFKRKIKRKKEGEQYFYIDSSHYIAYLNVKDDQHKPSRDLIHKIKGMVKTNPEIKVLIPSIVLAEVSKFICFEITSPDERENCFVKLVETLKDLKVEYRESDEKVWKMTKEIRKRDDRIEPADAFIAAHALCNPDSVYLFTTDNSLLTSEEIREIEREMHIKDERKRDLKISAEL